nr:cytochrome c oxidase subunit II [Gilvimarinus xylanilyticus]
MRAWGLVLTSVLATGCGGPQSALDPAGPGAGIIAWLWWGMFAFFTLVLILVTGLWLYAMKRRAPEPDEQQATRLTNRWIIGGGIILPLLSITVLLAAGIPAGQYILTLPDDKRDPLRIDAHAHRWWWGFYYPESDITTGNRLVIPVDTPIDVYGHTNNVIHAFWVPRLGGKIDVVPGRVNKIRLRASKTGTLRGQCAEFCGTGHAHMVFEVEVLSQQAFKHWQERQQLPVKIQPQHTQAAEAFQTYCGDCHRVRGVSDGANGPDLSDIAGRRLSHMQSRQKKPLSIAQWLEKPHPRFATEPSPILAEINPQTLERIATWLETLEP